MVNYKKSLQHNWNYLAENDPLWSILTYDGKKGGRWNEYEFFDTGRREIKELINDLKIKEREYNDGRALDFGCGVGRLTFPLSEYFNDVIGVDISPKMISVAEKYNEFKNVRFLISESYELKLFPDAYFDFIYSNIVLQHIKPRYTLRYLKSFQRILRKDGILVFQIPDRMKNRFLDILWNNSITHGVIYPIFQLFRDRMTRKMGLHPIRKKKILKFLTENDLTLLHCSKNENSGPRWVSQMYFVTKNN